MKIASGTGHIRRYLALATLVLKHGRRDLLEGAAFDDVFTEDRSEDDSGDAEGFVADLESLGPTFVKLGQLLSTRPDLLPPAYLDALDRLQDAVDPLPFEQVRQVVEEELGVRLGTAFARFDEVPLAAASLGQVHRGELRDGRPVAVKVQRPGIRSRVREDLDVLETLAGLVERTETGEKYQLTAILDEFRRSLARELDYRREARNLQTLAGNLSEFERIEVPQPVDDYTTSRVLTMELVAGHKVTELTDLGRLDIDGQTLAQELFEAYLRQILDDGFVHADPHPGNVFITDEDHLALLDLGMVVRLDTAVRDQLLRLLLAVAEGDAVGASEAAMAMCDQQEGADEAAFRREIAEVVGLYLDLPAEDLRIGGIVLRLARVAASTGHPPPPELTLLGRTLLNLDAVGRSLAPEFEPNVAIRRIAAEVASKSLIETLTPSRAMRSVLDAKEFAEELPGRLNRILERVDRGELRLEIDAIDETRLTRAIQKVANRVTMGLVLAALIVGAAMLMRVETEPRLFGYPALAIVAFLLAALGGVGLIASIVWNDRRDRH
ncbi:MAG: AarF/ABC1/UbiB kinase family protein [Actinobacteria bacterium]|nr:AarF/ABC1/UbiB kinase family protein [Actinomycetota bacterium]